MFPASLTLVLPARHLSNHLFWPFLQPAFWNKSPPFSAVDNSRMSATSPTMVFPFPDYQGACLCALPPSTCCFLRVSKRRGKRWTWICFTTIWWWRQKQISGEEGRKGSEAPLIWSPQIYNLWQTRQGPVDGLPIEHQERGRAREVC